MEYEETTEKIIGSAYKVYNTIGFGFLESVYEKCLLIELRKVELSAETQKRIPVSYQGEIVGDFTADMVVEGKEIGVYPGTGLGHKTVRRDMSSV